VWEKYVDDGGDFPFNFLIRFLIKTSLLVVGENLLKAELVLPMFYSVLHS